LAQKTRWPPQAAGAPGIAVYADAKTEIFAPPLPKEADFVVSRHPDAARWDCRSGFREWATFPARRARRGRLKPIFSKSRGMLRFDDRRFLSRIIDVQRNGLM